MDRAVMGSRVHDIGLFWIVNVANLIAGVGGHALAVEPFGVDTADGVVGQSAQVFERHGLAGDAGTVTEDTAAGGMRQHALS
jgi:hypothetical protein